MKHRSHELVKRFERLKAERLPFDSIWQELADFILPNSADFNRLFGIGQKRRQHIYDNTGEHSAKIFASSILGFLANPAARWFTLGVMDEEINSDQEVKEWLDMAGKISMNAFNEPAAKFYDHLLTTVTSIGVFGTAGMLTQEGVESKIEFSGQSPKGLFIVEGHNGSINQVFRELKFSGNQLLEKELFREWNLSEKTREKAIKDPDKKFDVIQVIGKREDKKTELSLSFESVYIEKETKHELKEDSHLTFPMPVARWEKTFTDAYGRSPGMVALSDVKTVNSMQKALLIASEKQLNPPMQMPSDGSLGMLNTSANAINFINPEDKDTIRPILSVGNLNVAREDLTAIQDSIRRAFFVDQLQIVGSPQMTATEVLQRQDEKGRLLAPSIGRIQSELLGPIVENVFSILLNNGTIPPAPQLLAGQDVKVVYVSPLTRAQRGGEAASLLEFMNSISGIAQINPDILDKIDFDAAIEELHEITGVPAKVLNTSPEVEQIRQAKQQQQQQQQLLDAAQQGASAAKDANQAGLL